MAATAASASSHLKSKHLESQAATAALYADRSANPDRSQYLDSDSKLSSAGAAASLKYANPQDLPSFPSRGLENGDSAAGVAATLGWQKKSTESWKPDPSQSATRAAMLANDYKAPPPWQPEQSTSGAQAAVLAARDGGKVEIWKPEQSSWGSSAANQAFKGEKNSPLSPKATALGKKSSLMAATGAMSGNRRRSDSMPMPPTYSDESKASASALSAATLAHNPSRTSRTDLNSDAGSSPFTNMPKEMFTSHPPVAPEVDEKKRADVLRASAVAMAKQMYSVQQKQIEQAQAQKSAQQSAAASAHGRKPSGPANDDVTPMRFNSLQEAAQKLAQERLAKLRNEHDQNREYRDYYGSSPQANRLTIRNRVRRRASSEGTLDEDQEQSQKIRAQMSIFTEKLTQVDRKKRQKDREALMAAAQRNVTASLKGMDEKAFKESGKIQPSMLSEWEMKAHTAAQQSSESRMEHYGKVNIGGGKFMDQSEVNAIAARNVQPVLDEINEKAESQRARDAELRLEQETRKREAETKKTRGKEVKEINRKLKEQDKEEEIERKKEEKAKRAEEKRLAKEDKRKSKEVSSPKGKEKAPTVEFAATTPEEGENMPRAETENDDLVDPVSPLSLLPTTIDEPAKPTTAAITPGYMAPVGLRTSMERESDARLEDVMKENISSAESPKGVRSWLKTKLRRSKDMKSPDPSDKETEKSFASGIAIPGASSSRLESGESSMKEVALAGKAKPEKETTETIDDTRLGRGKRRDSSVSSLSKTSIHGAVQHSTSDEFEEARDNFDDALAPPPTFTATKSASPVRDSKFKEVM